MVFAGCFEVFLLLLSSVSGLILPMKETSGEADMDSVISHVTLMEQTMANLQTQVQAGNTEIATVTHTLQTAEQTIATLQTQVQKSNTELATVKANLQTTEDELKATKSDITAIKAELKLSETDIAILKHDLPKNSNTAEFTQLKTEFEALKVSHNALVEQINFTVIDAVSSDVKTNMREIQSLKSEHIKTETEVNKTSFDLQVTRSEVTNLTSEVSTMNTKLNQSIQDAVNNKASIAILKTELTDVNKSINTTSTNIHSLETRLTSAETQYNSVRSRQNITEHEVAESKALAQSTAADLKTIQTQVTTVSTDVNDLHGELTVIKNKSDKDVAFQITAHFGGNGRTTLKFDTVDYNTGSAYNKTTGMFRAPVSGTYIFWANVVFLNPVGVHNIHIYKGSTPLAKGTGRLDDSADYGMASTMTTTHLDVGDQVHFTTDSAGNVIYGYGSSSYGGALLHAS